MGIHVVICEVDADARLVVQEAASAGLAEQLRALQAEIDAFDGTQRKATYTARLQALQALRTRATVYKETLGIGIEQAEAALVQLEAKVTQLFELGTDALVLREIPAQPRITTRTVDGETALVIDTGGAMTTDALQAATGGALGLPTGRPVPVWQQERFSW